MDGASGGVSVAIASRASAALGAGRVSQPHGSPASLVGSAGCSTTSHIDPVLVSLWLGRARVAGQGRGSLSGCTTESPSASTLK
jgi:hypothetical protein